MSWPNFSRACSIASDRGLPKFRRMQFWNFRFAEKNGLGAMLIFAASARP